MRKVLITSAVFFLLFVYWLVLSQLSVSVFPDELEPSNFPGFYDYRGITNVHTNRGIGGGSTTEVIQAAQEAGLDFLFLTELNQFTSQPQPDGYHRKLLVMNAAEYGYLESRILTYSSEGKNRLESIGQAQVYLADRLSQEGTDSEQELLMLAHPSRPGFAWTGPFPSGLDGFEVMNTKSFWIRAWNEAKISLLWSALVYPFHPQFSLVRLFEEPLEELKQWDQISSQRPFVGMAGADATSKLGTDPKFSVRFPSYQKIFSLLSNHILLRSELTGQVDRDRKKILKAMSDGQFYMCLDVLGNPKGFAAYVRDHDRIIPMGGRAKFQSGMKLMVHIPNKPRVPFETKFFRNGQELMASNSLDTEYEIHEKGVYRIIVRVFPTLTLPDGQRWMTWIYSNPFYIE
jgi:hypothetical protein